MRPSVCLHKQDNLAVVVDFDDVSGGGGTGVSGLTTGLATLPQGGSRSLQWLETGMKDPQEDPLAVHSFCVCSGSVLLGDLLGVSRSREHDLLSCVSC